MTYYEIEKGLITQYNSLQKKIKDIEAYKDVYEADLLSENKAILKELYNTKELSSEKLINLPEKLYTKNKIFFLYTQIQSLTDSREISNLGRRLSKSQGMTLGTTIYYYFITDMQDTLNNHFKKWHIQDDSFTESNFDYTQVKEVLLNFKEDLFNNPPGNYIELERMVILHTDRINETVINNQRQRKFAR